MNRAFFCKCSHTSSLVRVLWDNEWIGAINPVVRPCFCIEHFAWFAIIAAFRLLARNAIGEAPTYEYTYQCIRLSRCQLLQISGWGVRTAFARNLSSAVCVQYEGRCSMTAQQNHQTKLGHCTVHLSSYNAAPPRLQAQMKQLRRKAATVIQNPPRPLRRWRELQRPLLARPWLPLSVRRLRRGGFAVWASDPHLRVICPVLFVYNMRGIAWWQRGKIKTEVPWSSHGASVFRLCSGKLHFFSEIFLDSENFLRKSQIFRLHFLRKSKSYLRKCNLVFFSLGARFRITNYASENYF